MFHLGLLTYLQTTAWGDVVWSDPPGLRAASRRHLLVSLLARSWNLHPLRFEDGGDLFFFLGRFIVYSFCETFLWQIINEGGEESCA